MAHAAETSETIPATDIVDIYTRESGRLRLSMHRDLTAKTRRRQPTNVSDVIAPRSNVSPRKEKSLALRGSN